MQQRASEQASAGEREREKRALKGLAVKHEDVCVCVCVCVCVTLSDCVYERESETARGAGEPANRKGEP